MEKMARFTDEDGTAVMILVDPAGLKRLIQAAHRTPHRRAGSGPFLVQIEGPAKPKETKPDAVIQK